MGKTNKQLRGDKMINFKAPDIRELKPRILVLGIGGAGGNAIDGMIDAGLQGVEFIAVNTDAQDLKLNKAKTKIQLGVNLTTYPKFFDDSLIPCVFFILKIV